jgi:hypothetical protein
MTEPTYAAGLLAAALDPEHPERANDRAKRVIEAIRTESQREIARLTGRLHEMQRDLERREFCGHCGRKL